MTGIDRVVLDTNALLAPGRSGVDVFDEIERVVGDVDLVVPDAVARELRGLATDDPDAELGLDLLEDRCDVLEEGAAAEETADDRIVAMAAADAGADDGTAVMTNDAALRDRLHDVGVPVLFLRQERHVAISYP